MSNGNEETPHESAGIDDEALPDDLQPGEDNPLAESLEDGETVEGLLEEGKTPDESDSESDSESESEEG